MAIFDNHPRLYRQYEQIDSIYDVQFSDYARVVQVMSITISDATI